MSEIDWGWLRSFVAVSESGSLRDASRRIGLSQPTLSRHIQRLEEQLGVSLFDRTGRGLVLSPRGSELYESALGVKSSVDGFVRQASGLDDALEGSVRVTSGRLFGVYFIPQWIQDFRDRHPQITIDVVLDDSEVDLLTREAEIAVRQFRPSQLDLRAKRCGSVAIGFFATRGYLDTHGVPDSLYALSQHALIGYDQRTTILEVSAAMGEPLTRDHFVVRSDDVSMQVAACRAGLGIGSFSQIVGQACPELVEIMPGAIPTAQDVWLVAHPDLHRNPRVRAAFDDLAAWFARRLDPS
ncbi:MAG: LysR family transcriptional regulator [Myxococcota bacterium]